MDTVRTLLVWVILLTRIAFIPQRELHNLLDIFCMRVSIWKYSLSFERFTKKNIRSVSSLESFIPVSGFRMLRKEDRSPEFHLIAEKMRSLDFDFFLERATYRKQGFVFEATLRYDVNSAMRNNVDLGLLPYLAKINVKDLSDDQIQDALKIGRTVNSSATQLVSNHRQDHDVCDFTTSMFYMLVNCSCYITDIRTIITYQHESLMTEYLQFLLDQRKNACCPLMNRSLKNLGNCIPGKVSFYHSFSFSISLSVCLSVCLSVSLSLF